eukprot:2493578-Ditylum_brightwellii.AAC.1
MEPTWCGWMVYIPTTHSERVADTVELFPTTARMPKTSSADAATRAVLDLIKAIEHPHPTTPFPNIGNAQMSALRTLSDIFHQALQPAPTTLS